MLILICGETATGKTEIAKELSKHFDCKNLISHTTRPIRSNEKDGVDYHFISNEQFEQMVNNNEFIEYEEYTQNRFYGTSLKDIELAAKSDELYVAVKTPGGIRAIEKAIGDKNIYKVKVSANLGTRVTRYIDRVGQDKFNFDDMNEIYRRVNSDYGQFLNVEKEVNLVIENNSNSLFQIRDISKQIIKEAKTYQQNQITFEDKYMKLAKNVDQIKAPQPNKRRIDLDKVEELYHYEKDHNLPKAQCITSYFGDYGMPILKLGVTLQEFDDRYNEVFGEKEQAYPSLPSDIFDAKQKDIDHTKGKLNPTIHPDLPKDIIKEDDFSTYMTPPEEMEPDEMEI